jgi:autotransporter-associated beta strand protein
VKQGARRRIALLSAPCSLLPAPRSLRFERLEDRALLTISFANLGYTNPFPPAAQLGQPSQTTPNIFSDSFTDQIDPNGWAKTGVLNDNYWSGTTTVTRPLPGWLSGTPPASGYPVTQLSVEFWLRIEPGSNDGFATIISMPGFQASTNYAWSSGLPAGEVVMTFYANAGAEPLQSLTLGMPAVPDGQWHQYAATFDTRTAYYYMDGQLEGQFWCGNTATQIGPQNNYANNYAVTPTAITYNAYAFNAYPFPTINGNGMSEVRISNTVLTPWQVERNFENYSSYANTWYASPTGLSTNSGTESSPYDLATALSMAAANTEIVLLPGTYNGSQFDVTASGVSPLRNVLITGADYAADTTGQAIIQTSGGFVVSGTAGAAQYVTLRNLTFAGTGSDGLVFSGAGYGDVVDSCRITGAQGGMSVTNSPGYQDAVSGGWAQHQILFPGVTLENSVVVPAAGYTAVSYINSPTQVLRNDTIVGGATGGSFASASYDVSLLDDIFSGQTTACLSFSSDSETDGGYLSSGSALPGYEGDGNIYNPAGGGYVGTVGTTNYSTLDSFAEFWYVLQYYDYGSPIQSNDQTSGNIGSRSDSRSIQGAPTFVSAGYPLAGVGDFRLSPVPGNLINTGADRIFGREVQAGYPTVWDGIGAARVQGNAIDSGAFAAAAPIQATFSLTSAATTSAGVYDSNGNLVDSLWSGLYEPVGNLTAYWNGLNSSNAPVAAGNYQIKLLANNVQYVWDGTMNNSSPQDGPNINTSFDPIDSMVVIGNTAYYSPGYNEGEYQLYKFNLSNPNQVTGYGDGPVNTNTDIISHIATDGTYLYALLEKPGQYTPTIQKFDLNFNLLTTSGSVSSNYGSTGIAAQPAGAQNLVFVSHANDNKVYIYNESDLTSYSTPYLDGSVLGWNTPQAVAVDSAGNLWLACKNTATGQWEVLRYTNFGGTPTLAATITGFTNPIGLAVSTDGANTLMVADGEQSGVAVTQQIKAFNSAGTPLWTLGQAGGYATNGPAVTNTKFILGGMICPQPDGSFWITDYGGGNRTMHFSSTRQFLSDITFDRSYSAAVDQNNPAHVFQTIMDNSFIEYSINYSEPFTEDEGWTPIDDWTYLGNTNLETFAAANGVSGPGDGLAVVATLSNGRTYALVQASLITGYSWDNTSFEIVELTSTGLRDTGYKTTWEGDWLNADGSLTFIAGSGGVGAAGTGGVETFNKRALTGFDASGNPQYAPPTTVATVPWSYTWDTQPPAPASYAYYAPMYLTMPDGDLAVYNQWGDNAGMHMGAINPATGSYQWQAMPALGPLDGRGNFDTDVWYGGNRVMLDGSSVFVGFNGEGWIGQGQANQFMQFSDDGLFIGQFGSPQLASNSSWNRGYGMSGNSFSPFTVVVNGTTYLYLNDEADRSLQRWHLTGENTIQELAQVVAVGVPAAPTGLNTVPPSATQINLSWTAPGGTVTGYNVYRGTSPGGENYSAPLNGGTPVTTTTYSDTTAAPGTTYYYTVEAVNVSGSSAASNEAVVVDGAVLHAANYPLPAGAAVTVTDGGEIDLGGATTAVASLLLVSGSVVDGTLQAGGGVQVESGTISAALMGGSVLLKTGTGVATLSGSNTFSGGTVVSGGRLVVNASAALLDGSSLMVGDTAAFAFRPAVEASVAVSADDSYPAVPASATIAVGSFPKKAADSSAGTGSGEHGAGSLEQGVRQFFVLSPSAVPGTLCVASRSLLPARSMLAANESPWRWADWDQKTGPSLPALDAALARYGVHGPG